MYGKNTNTMNTTKLALAKKKSKVYRTSKWTDRTWFSCLLRQSARKRRGPILPCPRIRRGALDCANNFEEMKYRIPKDTVRES